jgi:hypothetical protein
MRSLNAAVDGMGSAVAEVCARLPHEQLCAEHGCTWALPHGWKCTSSGDANFEKFCNMIGERNKCDTLVGFCQAVTVGTAGPATCAPDCYWATEATKAFAVGQQVGQLGMSMEQVSKILAPELLPMLTQQPTEACPQICDGKLLHMWLEAGMNDGSEA